MPDEQLLIEVPDAPSIGGLRFRHLRDRGDYAAIAEVIAAANVADGLDYVPTADNIRIEAENAAGIDPYQSYVLAEVDGRVVAVGDPHREVRDGVAVYQTIGSVLPGFRRRGLGRAILRRNERFLRELADRHDDPGGRTFGSWAQEREGGAYQLLAEEGYGPVRYGFAMIRRGLDALPIGPLPPGLEIRPVREDQHRVIWEADDEAFHDHWGHREAIEEDFRELFEQPDLDTSLWRVAWDGGEVAGSVQAWIWKGENETLGVRRGWLERISVRRPWRRRGLARALIVSAFDGLRAAGMDEVMLGVDSENVTGALRLYEDLGFVVKDRSTVYRKPM